MKIEDLQQLWDQDCELDINNIGEESLKIPKLHAKYRRLYFDERARLIQMKADYKIFKLDKQEFLVNPTKDRLDQGWKIPAQGKLLKSELSSYLEGDKDLVTAERNIALQDEKVDFLKSILDHLKTRGLLIKNFIDDRRWLGGQ